MKNSLLPASPHRFASTPVASNSAPELTDVLAEGQKLERHGKREAARALYREALNEGSVTDAAGRAQLFRWISRTYMHDSRYVEATRAAQEALDIAEAVADERSRGHAINTLAVICWAQGQLDESERLYKAASESARSSGDAMLSAMTASNLGIVATIRGDHAEALQFHMSSLADARAAGLAVEAMKALNNLGLLHTQMGRLDDAEKSYAEALEIGEVIGDLSMCIIAQLNVARLAIKRGEHSRARTACDRATAMAAQLGETHAEGEAEHIYGIIARAAGDASAAEQHFLRAESAAVRKQDLILRGETSRELADLYRAQGRNRETLQRLNQAHRFFGQLRARRELADIDRRAARLESDFLEVVRRWGDSIESKDFYTQGHCVRVADLACAIWAKVNVGDDTSLFWFRIGALLHDVGKLMVPADILNKSGPLTPEEWEMVRRHPSAGVELLADIDFPWDVRPIVESHHERWDGKGYPHGLAGEDIPFTARVLCVADVYDALTSQRSYKAPLSHAQAMDIMRRDVGTQFDPTIFASFEEIVRRGAWRA